MKRLLLGLSLVIGAWMLSPTPKADAENQDDQGEDGDDQGEDGQGNSRVPELDSSAAGSAMVLLLGGVAYIASRRRKEDLA